MSSIRATLPFPTKPWEVAKANFLEGLSDEERRRFENATLENTFYDASAVQKKHAMGSKAWAIQDKLTSLVEGIDDYGKALDVYSNASPIVLCPIWGSVRIVLHIAREAGRFQEKLVDMLARIGDTLPHFRIYEKLFHNHTRLLRALSDAYLDVLQFCTLLKEFLVKARKSAIPLTIVCMGAWKPLRKQFDDYVDSFRKHQKNVKKEAGLAHMIEAAHVREIEQANRALQERNEKIMRRHKIISSLSTVDYHKKHASRIAQRHPGTNGWLQQRPMFQEWISSPSSDCFCCYGIPGAGKSILSASVINDLEDQITTEESILVYYYFDWADTASLDFETLVGSLLKQVLLRLPLEVIDTFPSPSKDGEQPVSVMELQKYLQRLLAHYKKAVFVLDGFDELRKEGQACALKFVNDVLEDSRLLAKVFITSRPEELSIRNRLKSWKSFELSADELLADIALFVEDELNDACQGDDATLAIARLRPEIVQTLVERAHGMFLWVKFQLMDLREAYSDDAVRKALRDLPRDLPETYSRILTRIYQSPGGSLKFSAMEKVLRWVACAKRPLRIKELEEALALDKSDTYLHFDRVATGAGDKIISACGNLVTYDRTNRTVNFAHHTVLQFVLEPFRYGSYPESLHFDSAQADREIGQICIAYLSFSDFETQIVKPTPPAVLSQQAIDHIIWGRIPFSSHIRRLVRGATPASGQTSLSTKQFAFPVPAGPSPGLQVKYMLLEYIVDFWAFHTFSFHEHTACWPAFKDVTLYRHLLFEHRPWNMRDKNPQHINRPENHAVVRLCRWTIHHGAVSFLDLLCSQSHAMIAMLSEPIVDEWRCCSHCPLQATYSQFLAHFKEILAYRETMPPFAKGSFWTGSFLYWLTASKPKTFAPASQILRLLHHERCFHTGTDRSLSDPLFLEATMIAVRKCNEQSLKDLLDIQNPNFDWLSSILARGIEEESSDLSIEILVPTILCFGESTQDGVELTVGSELSNTLKKCLEPFQGCHTEFLRPWIYHIRLDYKALLVAQAIETSISKYGDLILALLANENVLYPSTSIYLKEQSRITGLLSHIFRRVKLLHDAKHWGTIAAAENSCELKILLRLIELEGSRLDRPQHEWQDPHYLSWAVEWRMLKVVASLMPDYQHVILRASFAERGAEILVFAVLHWDECLEILLEYVWSDETIDAARKKLGESDYLPLSQSSWDKIESCRYSVHMEIERRKRDWWSKTWGR